MSHTLVSTHTYTVEDLLCVALQDMIFPLNKYVIVTRVDRGKY